MYQAFIVKAEKILATKTKSFRRRKKKHIQKLSEINTPLTISDNTIDKQSDCECNNSIINSDFDNNISDNKSDTIDNRNISFKENEPATFCFHLGVLVFAPFFNKLFDNGLHYIRQFLVAVLLGCQNIEQTKELNYSSMNQIIGKTYKTLRLQRITLKDAATKSNTEHVLQFNAELLKVNRQQDFYYDPHTKHYTGHLKILSTWCPSVRLADKGINMDYIHTTSGHPVYFNTNNNFYDLRERFSSNINDFRTLLNFDKKSVLTYIIDRGIYSLEVFNNIIEDPRTHIITWEKGYDKNKWDTNATYGTGAVVKKRNNKNDIRLVYYHYQEKIWDKNPKMKQIIVRIFDKNWNVLIEVSILTDDKNRSADEIIELMLCRWVQENDFKYMIKHFGINQITSYAFTDYKALRDTIEDKVYTCSKHKFLTKEIQKIRAKLKTALLREFKFTEKHKNSEKKISPKEQKRKEKIRKSVSELNASLTQLEQERKNTVKQVSRIGELIDQDYKKLQTNTKDFLDAIKILARNIFYLSFQSMKDKYDNYRDDHVLFRHLTRSAGTIVPEETGLKILLTPQMEYQPGTKKIISQVLEEINEMKPEIPDGSKRKIRLHLNI